MSLSKTCFSQALQEILVVWPLTNLRRLISRDKAWLRLDTQQATDESLGMKARDADWDEFRHGGSPVAAGLKWRLLHDLNVRPLAS